MKRTSLAYIFSLAFVIMPLTAQAGPLSGEFCMFNTLGDTVSDVTWGTTCDEQVTGDINDTVFSVASPQLFFGRNWFAHDGVIYGEGTHMVDTIQGGVYTFTVGPGQVGGHILFDWGVSLDIDVVLVWDVDCVITPTNEECTYTSTDWDGDGIPGGKMIDGDFLGFSANFNFVALFPLAGSPTFTPPADIDDFEKNVTETPADVTVELGTVTDEDPPTASVEYSIDGVTWIADDGTTNPITFTLTETVNDLVVDWRATDPSLANPGFATQNVRVTIQDLVPPVITGTPADAVVDVTSTSDTVCFAGSDTPWGMLEASDAIEPNVIIEYSLNNFDFLVADPADDQYCNTDFGPGVFFGPGENTVYWRVSDKAVDAVGTATPNIATYEQAVILNLPTGIVGKPCSVDLSYPEFRELTGTFIMRDPTGAIVPEVDNTVTGEINTTLLCTDSTHGACTDVGASLKTDQPFQGLLWTADPVKLYGVGDWTFETCPDDPEDNSVNCDKPDTTLDLTVLSAANNINNPGIEQLGAHMLFAWGSTDDIDVVVAWDVDCGASQLTTTDPDGDGILGTRMVDGPFEGFNAAFDVSATGVDPNGDPVPLIADGGYTTTIPAYRNQEKGASPLPLTHTILSASQLPADDEMVSSCNVGGCYEFETDGVIPATDANGDYQFVQVVLPLSGPIPWYSLYRVIVDPANGTWQTFIPDARNDVKSALLNADGSCPEPGAGDYRVADVNSNLEYMLQPDDQCIQLTVEDNGPYDSDNRLGHVKDPSGIALTTAAQPRPDAKTTGDGGCSLSGEAINPLQRAEWGLLAGLLALLGFSGLRRRRGQR